MNTKNLRCELLEIEGAQNVRDIGGYRGTGGQVVRKRRFLRAGSMSTLTAAGVAAVRALGVDCVVDLRSTAEAHHRPDTLAEDRSIDYVHVPMLDSIQSNIASGGPTAFPESMAHMYIGLLEESQDRLLRVFQTFAEPDYGVVLFHCTAGKDRTGITAMLLLGLAGVSRADIVEDYAHSERLLDQGEIPPDLPRYLFESAPETMEAAIDHLEAKYGGIPQYLEKIGVDTEMKAAVLRKLLDE